MIARLLLRIAAMLVVLGASAARADDGLPQSLETSPLLIETRDGARHAFTVEVADEFEEMRIGLMNRRSLRADAGMLFLYGRPRGAAMWMKNTYIPLDILFIQSDGRIANIAVNTTPLSLETIPARGRVAAALELAGGTTVALGIKAGDKVLHPGLGNWPEDQD